MTSRCCRRPARSARSPGTRTEEIAHDKDERGVPGYYTVRLPSAGVTAELTATNRTGVGRFHYPSDRAGAVLRAVRRVAGRQLGRQDPDRRGQHHDHRVGDQRWVLRQGQRLHGVLRDEVQQAVHVIRHLGRLFGISQRPQRIFELPRVQRGIRGVPGRHASSRCEPRCPTWTSTARARTSTRRLRVSTTSAPPHRTQWNDALSRIRIAGYTEDDIVTFYSALYHSLLNPNTFNDVDGRYIGFDGEIHTVAPGHTQYANYSDWDTYRGVAALQGMVFPREASDMAQSLVNDAEQSGSYPRWALANTATAEMTGDSVVPLIANFYAFGAKDFDVAAGAALHARRRERGRCRAATVTWSGRRSRRICNAATCRCRRRRATAHSRRRRSRWSGRSTTSPSPNSPPR